MSDSNIKSKILNDNVLNLMIANEKHFSSLEDSISTTQENITKSVKDSKVINDSYGNTLTATGNDDKVQSFTNYGFSNDTLNWTLWLALYNDSWVFRRAIDKPAQDMVKCGITLNCEHENKEKVYTELKKNRFHLIEILQWGALFGGSIGVMMFDNFEDADYSKPINKDKLRQAKIMRIYTTDRWYGVAPSDETVTNMKSLDFSKPQSYRITFSNGKTLEVHHDYILRYENRTAPKLIKNGQLQGWGYAEGAHILNELSRDDQLKASITSLVNKSLIEVIKMSGMRGVFMGADSENETQLRKRLEMVNWGRSYNSLTFLDKDDEYQEHGFSGLGGLSDLLEKNMWLISAALEMQGVLYGDLKQGFANDTDALERYDETIQNRCESYFRPVLEKLIFTLYLWFDIDEKVEFTFNSLLMSKQDEKRLDTLSKFQGIVSSLIGDGILDTQHAAKAIQTFITKDTLDLGLDDEYIESLKDKMAEEMENIDIDEDVDDDSTLTIDSVSHKKKKKRWWF